MAQPLVHRLCGAGWVRYVLILVSLCLFIYIVGRQPSSGQGQLKIRKAFGWASCRKCSCDCFPEPNSMSMPADIFDRSFLVYADCAKNDPEMNEEMTKDMISLLSEVITLQKNVSRDILDHAGESIRVAKEIYLMYYKEAEKGNKAIEICELGRESAEAALVEEIRLSALWEQRAREFGWEDEWTDSRN